MTTSPRTGGMIFRFVFWLAFFLVAVALVFATWAAYRRDGAVSFRPLDAAWWQSGKAEAEPVLAEAQRRLWEPGGYADQAERWWRGHSATQAPASGPLGLEARFAQALTDYRNGDISDGRFTPERRAHLESAMAGLGEVDAQLTMQLLDLKDETPATKLKRTELLAWQEHARRLRTTAADVLAAWPASS